MAEDEQFTREAYGRALVEIGKGNPNVIVLDADLSSSTQTRYFAQAFPDRFFNCGLAEQNMIGIAAGLASSGKVVFVSTFAVFAPGRCFDQIRMCIAQPSSNVKIVPTHGGITVGEDGISHHAIEDLSLICTLPNIKVIVPSDAVETEQAVRVAAETPGPFFIRLGRSKVPVICHNGYKFTPGKAYQMREGKAATIIACGIMVSRAIKAAQGLAQQGIECRVLNMSTLKPLDEEAIISAAEDTGAIVTAEEHLLHGGLGSRVSQVILQSYPVPVEYVALKDTFARSGKPEELLHLYGLDEEAIIKAVLRVISRKKSA